MQNQIEQQISDKKAILVLIFFYGLQLLSIIRYCLTHSFSKLFDSIIYISLPMVLFGLSFACYSHWTGKIKLRRVLPVLYLVGSMLIYGPFIYSLGATTTELAILLDNLATGSFPQRLFTVSVALVLGLILFYFRLSLRFFYGFVEFTCGLTIAYNKVNDTHSGDFLDPNFMLAFLTAGLYLIVRGLDNMHTGLTKEPLDPIASKYFIALKQFLDPRFLRALKSNRTDSPTLD